VSEALGISALEVYTVELPPEGETVRHDHLDDGVEDLYFIVSGDGWVLVDGEQLPLRPGLFVAVTVESAKQVRAGTSGLTFIALCGSPR
jgi:mannose-6-phosphate isomerase-like protein (cupin superfamily)